jgi:hypothetical protein
MARNPAPTVGQRIRAFDLPGVQTDRPPTGTIAAVHDNAIDVTWDDPELNARELFLMSGVDRWEALPDA